MVKKIKLFGINIPILGKVIDDEDGHPFIVMTKKNVGRKDTAIKTGILPPPPAEDDDDGIWYDEMTDAQKEEHGFMKGIKKVNPKKKP